MPDDIRKINISVWARSSHCGEGNCLEFRYTDDHLFVRDSKAGDATGLTFERHSWSAFLEHCIHCHYDQLP
jgi:hypothetical protein